MARIYIGRTTGIGSFERHVVLKVILPERANDQTSVQMFLDEARLAASLNHQNVAQVFEVGEDAGIHFLAMEYVHGQDLRALLAKAGSEGTRVPLELALTVVSGAAAGLEHAHDRRTSDGVPMGIVHRDVSPSNIMIGYDGSVKLLDFGIAKAAERSVETQSGVIKGKFAYMSPEQCRGRDVDRRSDVFSLGIILYEVTTQHRCFRADSDFDTMHRIVTGDVVRPTRLVQGYPQALEAIVMKALAIEPTQRYQSAGFLLEAVESFAVAARMSLSTMSLGRFMRDMFGDVQEPWLVAGRTGLAPPPKEHTISSTNASQARPLRPSAPPPVQHYAVQHHEEAPLHLPPDSALLEIPQAGEPQAPGDPGRGNAGEASWQAPEYPQAPPAYPAATPVPQDTRRSSSALSPMPVQHASPASPAAMPMGMAVGMMQPSLPPFAAQGGPDPGQPYDAAPQGGPIASTRQGYTGAPGLGQSEPSYPSYEPPVDSEEDFNLAPRNRLLYVGLGVVLLGVVLLVVWISHGGSDDLSPPATRPSSSIVQGAAPGSDEATPGPAVRDEATPGPAARDEATPGPAAAEVPRPEAVRPEAVKPEAVKPEAVKPEAVKPEAVAVGSGSDVGSAAVHEESITIHVVSDPPGADVLFAGKPIGTTPLETKVPRSTGFGTLTVHHAKFEDVTTTIDLSSDYRRELTLKPIPDEPPPPVTPVTPVRPANPGRPAGGRGGERSGGGERGGGERGGGERGERGERGGNGKPHSASPTPAPPPAPPAKKCQPPDKFNPFDTSCGGEACPPCG